MRNLASTSNFPVSNQSIVFLNVRLPLCPLPEFQKSTFWWLISLNDNFVIHFYLLHFFVKIGKLLLEAFDFYNVLIFGKSGEKYFQKFADSHPSSRTFQIISEFVLKIVFTASFILCWRTSRLRISILPIIAAMLDPHQHGSCLKKPMFLGWIST